MKKNIEQQPSNLIYFKNELQKKKKTPEEKKLAEIEKNLEILRNKISNE